MPFQKGQVANPGGTPRADREAISKIRMSINKAIDKMKVGEKVGVIALQDKIARALEGDTIKVLKDLASYMPKDLTIETMSNVDADKLTDAELANIIAKRARKRLEDQEPAILAKS